MRDSRGGKTLPENSFMLHETLLDPPLPMEIIQGLHLRFSTRAPQRERILFVMRRPWPIPDQGKCERERECLESRGGSSTPSPQVSASGRKLAREHFLSLSSIRRGGDAPDFEYLCRREGGRAGGRFRVAAGSVHTTNHSFLGGTPKSPMSTVARV